MWNVRVAVVLGALLIVPLLLAPQASIAAGDGRYHPVAERTFESGQERETGRHAMEASRRDIGSRNTVTADPPIPRPAEVPCVVTLFRGARFADFTPKAFAYAPPAACPGPWEKVVLDGDFSVSAGRQFDRTAQISIANVNLYFGTTPEPSHDLAPTWHVERELTDESALLEAAHAGEADLGNVVNATYTGVITGTAYLQFYPLHGEQRVRRPDVVLPVPNVAGGAQILSTPTSVLTQTYVFPRNVERAYLDVIAQSQGSDEFWYTCVPNDVAAALFSCGNTAFRESEVAIDGRPAGVAPVFPWIYTGGIDPYLWRPIPGVQTLDFKPFRVDLTPFAALLDDGKPHTVALGVFDANNYFQATSTLLLYLDRGAKQVTGALTSDSLGAAPAPVVRESISSVGGYPNGKLSVSSTRSYRIEGFVTTSHGTTTTVLDGHVHFSNEQRIANSATTSRQDIAQETLVETTTRRQGPGGVAGEIEAYHYPLSADIDLAVSPTQYAQTTKIRQGFVRGRVANDAGKASVFGYSSDVVSATDTLDFDSNFNLLGHSGQASSQRYFTFGSGGACYEQTIVARNDVLVAVRNGCRDAGDASGVLRLLQRP